MYLCIVNDNCKKILSQNIFIIVPKKIMKEKLIITLWKAQLSIPFQSDSIYCLMSYNGNSKTSKQLESKKSFEWKETFIFSLAK